MGNHGATTQATSSWGQGVALGQRVWGAARVPQNRSTLKPERAAPPARLLRAGATPASSPPSLVHGGSVLALPWAGLAMGLALAREPLCLGAGGSEGRGASASSGPPGLSCCSGDGGIRPHSDVSVPRGRPHGSAGAPCRAPCLQAAASRRGDSQTSPLGLLGAQDLAFLPLGSGAIAQSDWAVTACFSQ